METPSSKPDLTPPYKVNREQLRTLYRRWGVQTKIPLRGQVVTIQFAPGAIPSAVLVTRIIGLHDANRGPVYGITPFQEIPEEGQETPLAEPTNIIEMPVPHARPSNMARDHQWLAIINGEQKFVSSDGVNFQLESDRWSPPPTAPLIKTAEELFRHMRGREAEVSRLSRHYIPPEELEESIERAVGDDNDGVSEYTGLSALQINQKDKAAQWNKHTCTQPEVFIAHQLELDERSTPGPDSEFESTDGWILPDGKFYPCRYMEHIWLADRLAQIDESEAEKRGWIKVTDGLTSPHCMYFSGRRLTQKQRNTVFDYCEKWGLKQPDFLEKGDV